MADQPVIDIIIPNFNKAKYLEECLNSIINQTYKSWIVYLIDDNSNDNSSEILKKYEKFENIKIFKLKKNEGPSYCRNLGINKSNSQYVAFMDSDDFWPENKLAIQIKSMIKNNYSFTYTDFQFFFNNNLKKIKNSHLPLFFDYKKFLIHSSMSTSSIIVKRELLKDIIFKKVNHEDYLFKCDLLKSGEMAFKINETFVYYRITNMGRSSSKINNILSLWKINKYHNNLKFLSNLKSISLISFNSLKKYGWK